MARRPLFARGPVFLLGRLDRGEDVLAGRKERVFELGVEVESDLIARLAREAECAKDQVGGERPRLRAVVCDVVDSDTGLFERFAAHGVLERFARLHKPAA